MIVACPRFLGGLTTPFFDLFVFFVCLVVNIYFPFDLIEHVCYHLTIQPSFHSSEVIMSENPFLSGSSSSSNEQQKGLPRRKRGALKRPSEAHSSIQKKRGLPREDGDPHPKRGAPKGNNNALKHGFYSRKIPVTDLAGLDQTLSTNLEDEIEVMRIFMRRVVELGSKTSDLEKTINLLRILTFASMGINRLVRTQITLANPSNEANLLQAALAELEDEWPELHECKERLRNSGAMADDSIHPLP
jgi:hypothetical protein